MGTRILPNATHPRERTTRAEAIRPAPRRRRRLLKPRRPKPSLRILMLAAGAAWATAFALYASPVSAAPLWNMKLFGRIEGSGDPFAPTVSVTAAGVSIEYELVGNMSP